MGTNRNEPSSSAMAASVGFTLLLPLPRFPFCDRLAVRVTARAPCPPAAVGLPTPSLYCVSLARLRGGGAGAVDASEGGAVLPVVGTLLSSLSVVSWMEATSVGVEGGLDSVSRSGASGGASGESGVVPEIS